MQNTRVIRSQTVDAVCAALVCHLAESDYEPRYDSEGDFEAAIWDRVRDFMSTLHFDPQYSCLTSHVERVGRSQDAWDAFLKDERGPDVRALGSNNRLDIVVKCDTLGSIGLEVKCLGDDRNADRLVHGIGQATLALENRDRTILIVFCGGIEQADRPRLRQVLDRATRGSRVSIVLVPYAIRQAPADAITG